MKWTYQLDELVGLGLSDQAPNTASVSGRMSRYALSQEVRERTLKLGNEICRGSL